MFDKFLRRAIRPEPGKDRVSIVFGAVVLVVLVLLPLFIDINLSYIGYFLFIVFIFVIIAQGWNVVAGYAGQLSLGGHAFFGLGAYVTFIIWLHHLTHTFYYFDPLVMFLAGLVPVVLAIIVGIPLLARLHGDYFAFGTLGVGEIVAAIILQGGNITNGGGGLQVPSSVYTSMAPYYWIGLALAVASTAAVFFLTRSRYGLAMKAIREDETAAASHGVNVLKYKVIAFAISAFMAGVAGSLYSYYLFSIEPDSVMSLNWLLYPVLVCVLGGFGTVIGPVAGALFVGALFSYGSIILKQTHPLLTGGLIIVIMLFAPTGLMGLKDRFLSRG
jgi:branched-chain amino acid transport system permease protein